MSQMVVTQTVLVPACRAHPSCSGQQGPSTTSCTFTPNQPPPHTLGSSSLWCVGELGGEERGGHIGLLDKQDMLCVLGVLNALWRECGALAPLSCPTHALSGFPRCRACQSRVFRALFTPAPPSLQGMFMAKAILESSARGRELGPITLNLPFCEALWKLLLGLPLNLMDLQLLDPTEFRWEFGVAHSWWRECTRVGTARQWIYLAWAPCPLSPTPTQRDVPRG